MTIFVDTSALIALLDEDDARHPEAATTFRWLARTEDLVTHNYVHVEALAVARRRLGARASEMLIEALFPALRTIWITEPLHRTALAAHRASTSDASLVDHVSFLVMRGEGIDVAFAYDRDFQAQGFRAAVTPPEAPRPRQLMEAPATYGTAAPDAADLVSVSEISVRAGRPINTIQSWRRRHRDFPAPVVQLAAGPIWDWPTIAQWISTRTTPRAVRHA